MMVDILVIPFGIGLMGAGHCFAMCGGIVGALSFSTLQVGKFRQSILIISYNLGRILSYGLLGIIAGSLGGLFTSQIQPIIAFPLLRLVAALLIVFLGFYILGVPQLLAPLEKVGSVVWKFIQPLAKKFLPITNPMQGLMVGLVWGWLPCGLVYTSLSYAIAQESLWLGGAVMLAFGLGTLPALIIGGLAGQGLRDFLRNRHLRRVSGTILVIYGLWSLVAVLAHHDHQHREPSPEHFNHHHSGA